MPFQNVSIDELDDLERTGQAALRALWLPFVVQGAIFVALGTAAVIAPNISTYAVELIIGATFLMAGIVGLVTIVAARDAPGFSWLFLASALLLLVAGGLLLWNPYIGVLSLTTLMIAFFLADAIASVGMALEYRRALPGVWGWIAISGLVDLALAVVIWAGWPGSATWAIGLLAGANLNATGATFLLIGLTARSLTTQ